MAIKSGHWIGCWRSVTGPRWLSTNFLAGTAGAAGPAVAGLGARSRPPRPASAIALTFAVNSFLNASAEWISLVELGFDT